VAHFLTKNKGLLMKNAKFILACLSLSAVSSASFAGAYTSINIGISKLNKPFTKLSKETQKKDQEEVQTARKELQKIQKSQKETKKDAVAEDVVPSIKGKSKMRFCGDLRIGYDHDLSSAVKIGAFCGFGLGGGIEELTVTENKKETTKSKLAVRSYIPVGLRFGYRITPDSTIFLSGGYARIGLKASSVSKEEAKTHKLSMKAKVNGYFIGLGFETPMGNSKNIFLNAQLELVKAKYKIQDNDDQKQKLNISQTRFTVGVVYRF
jgi:opacity protein-like surface antigen